MKSSDDVRKMIQKLDVEPSADMDENVYRLIDQRGSIIMNSKRTKYAAAVILLIGIVIGARYFDTSLDGSSVAWAAIAERVSQTKAFVYHIVSINEGSMTIGEQTIDIPDMEMTYIISEQYGMKIETRSTANGETTEQVGYMLPSENHMLMVMPAQKQYMRFSFDDNVAIQMRAQQEHNDPRQMFQWLVESDHVELGRKILNGVEVQGIETTDPKYGGGVFDDVVVRIWVEVESGWPVLMEMDGVMDSGTGEGTSPIRVVVDGFQWDRQMDPAEFVPDIPADYREIESLHMPAMDASGAIQGFELFARFTGRYPADLKVASISNDLMAAVMDLLKHVKKIEEELLLNEQALPAEDVVTLLQQRLKDALSERFPDELLDLCLAEASAKARKKLGLSDDSSATENDQASRESHIMQQTMQLMMPLQAITMFNMQLVQQAKDPRYYGDRVQPGNATQILMAWQGEAGGYEVIYGDLHRAVIAADQLPE